METESKNLFGLAIEGQVATTISSTAQWGRVLAICGIIMGAIIILAGIVVIAAIGSSSSGGSLESGPFAESMALGAGFLMVFYIVMGGLTILGNIFLLQYANRVSSALKSNDAGVLNSAFTGLRNYLAFWAVIMILCLLLTLLSVLSAV